MLKHAEEIGSKSFPDHILSAAPDFSNAVLQDIAMIEDRLSLDQLRKCTKVIALAEQYRCDPDFSRKVRRLPYPHPIFRTTFFQKPLSG